MRVDPKVDDLSDPVACKTGSDLGSGIRDREAATNGHLHLLIAPPEFPVERPSGCWVDGMVRLIEQDVARYGTLVKFANIRE